MMRLNKLLFCLVIACLIGGVVRAAGSSLAMAQPLPAGTEAVIQTEPLAPAPASMVGAQAPVLAKPSASDEQVKLLKHRIKTLRSEIKAEKRKAAKLGGHARKLASDRIKEMTKKRRELTRELSKLQRKHEPVLRGTHHKKATKKTVHHKAPYKVKKHPKAKHTHATAPAKTELPA